MLKYEFLKYEFYLFFFSLKKIITIEKKRIINYLTILILLKYFSRFWLHPIDLCVFIVL